MSELKQAARNLAISTPLGQDKLVVQSIAMSEGISTLFTLHAVLLSESNDIKPSDLLGKAVTVRVSTPEPHKKDQFFNGFVSRFAQGAKDHRVTTYYMEVVPWLWFLTQTSDLRIFQKKSVPDIIKQVFKDLGFTDFKMSVQGTFQPRDYCVQYRETDFAFVSRLMEEEGMFYFFEHVDGKHTLVVGNEPGVHKPQGKFDKYRYVPKGGEDQEDGGITNWRLGQAFRSGKYALNDYYFETPQTDQKVNAPSVVKVGGNDKFEIYDYPGEYAKRFDGDDQAAKVRPDAERTVKLWMQAIEAQHKQVEGESTLIGMSSGFKFDLVEHHRGDMNGSYVLTEVRHTATQNPYASADDGSQDYHCTFTCIPLAVPFRPQRRTSKPVVHGVQTAVVVGVQGEEIDTDKYGRVKVQFHWDREGKKDHNSSCWVRVATMWAGKQWGMIHIPRIGQEVVVAFMEGDPDQPIIVGSVYNADQMPPWKLPDNKTQSGIVTRSSLKGTSENYNEISFEDKKGEELLYVRAEKDFKKAVENDETIWVGHDRFAEVDNAETLIIDKGNREETLNEGNDTLTIKKGNREATIEMGNETLTIKMGNQTTKLDLGKSETEALQSIELKVGQSSLKVDQMGVTIKGLMINIEGTAQTQVKGLITQIQGSAMLQAGGGIMMLG